MALFYNADYSLGPRRGWDNGSNIVVLLVVATSGLCFGERAASRYRVGFVESCLRNSITFLGLFVASELVSTHSCFVLALGEVRRLTI